jgi:two-component system sensor histidine kinase BaeS
VAPPALLFVGDPVDAVPASAGLSGPGTVPVVSAALLVLVFTVGTSFALSTRLVRPIRALTVAARRMRDGDRTSRMTARSTGEVALLAEAFNEMSAHLQRTEEQRKALMSDVSHELRTPLSNIRGYLESAQDGVRPLDPTLVSSLLEETLLLQHLVQDLQDLALAEAGELRLHPEPMAVADLLDQVAAAHRARAETAGITLSTEVDGDPGLTADPVRLRQAVGNLVSNALRHTPAGGSVRLAAHEKDGSVVVEVADTGSGIAAEDLPHVFDRFWRADKSRNRRSGGSGLGLAIVRNLVQAHDGTVEVTSTPGAGTVFVLRLPSEPN